MIVLSSGCSMIWGSELSDDLHPNHSYKTWPALLAKDLGAEYCCVATPGGSNATIARSIIEQIERDKSKDFFVVVQWTFPSRQEFRFNQSIPRNKDYHYFSVSPWTMSNNPERDKLLNSDRNDQSLEHMRQSHQAWQATGILEFSDAYYRHVSCEETDAYNMFKEIIHLKLYLESKKISYAFSAAESSLIRKYMIDPSRDDGLSMYACMCQEINWMFFEPNGLPVPMGFYEWALATRQKMGVAFHPLDQAHETAYNIIKDRLYELAKTFD